MTESLIAHSRDGALGGGRQVGGDHPRGLADETSAVQLAAALPKQEGSSWQLISLLGFETKRPVHVRTRSGIYLYAIADLPRWCIHSMCTPYTGPRRVNPSL